MGWVLTLALRIWDKPCIVDDPKNSFPTSMADPDSLLKSKVITAQYLIRKPKPNVHFFGMG